MTISVKPVQAHPWGGLVIDAAGTVFFSFICPLVSDSHVACILELDQDRSIAKAVISAKTSPSDFILARSFNRQIYGAERDLLRGQYQARLWKLGITQEILVDPTVDASQFSPEAYTLDDAGNMYFAHEAKIIRRSPEGIISTFAGSEAGVKDGRGFEAQFERISVMAHGPEGFIYVVDKDRLRTIDTDGNVVTLTSGVKEDSPANVPFTGANIIFDIAVDSLHNTYLAYYGNRRVLKVTPDGQVTTLLDSGDEWSPHGVDVYEGEVYVLESSADFPEWWEFWKSFEIRPRIRKVNAEGVASVVYEYVGG